MKTPPRYFSLLATIALCSLGAFSAQAGELQPHMRNAINALEKAKRAGDPLPLLQIAKSELQHAAPDKGGKRVDAMVTVQEAIAEARRGHHGEMENRIDRALVQAYYGFQNAR